MEYILQTALNPEEIIIFLIFAWAAILFIKVRQLKIKQLKIMGSSYYDLWLAGIILWTLSTACDTIDNLQGMRIFNSLEHIAFFIGSILFTLGLFYSYKKYKNLGEKK
ncbi:MAG: hypothetical protein KAT77_05435 [Nanoarchaeota archaeon]|nr:hypothetical protein [Nanoarchaeota archaeon]